MKLEALYISDSDIMNDNRNITRFLLRSVLAAIPLLLLITVYIILDPFKIVNPPYPYFAENSWETELGWNKGWVSVTAYEHGYQSNKYDSFIFGSSISIPYRADDWKKRLPSNAAIFHFDSSKEHIHGILKKLQYIDKSGDTIHNALIVLDPQTFRERQNDGYPFYIPPQLTGWWNYPAFHYTYFKYFLNRDFLTSYIPFLITGNPINYSKEDIFNRQPFTYDKITNEESTCLIEARIISNPDSFYLNTKIDNLPDAKIHHCKPLINDTITTELQQIANLLNKHNTDYRIVFGPNRHKEILCPSDMSILYNLFDADKIYRYSALDTVTEDKRYYYDNTHYRSHVCAEIIECAYSK